MAKQIPAQPKILPELKGETYAIVHSSYHAQYVDAMLESAKNELLSIDPDANIIAIPAPGAFEIPVICNALTLNVPCAAIIALGVILKGETAHADLIAQSITNSLQNISLEAEIPIIHEVLLLENEQQAKERCLGDPNAKLNRGVEAARAAIACANSICTIESMNTEKAQDDDDDSNSNWLDEILNQN
ncbi:MAG: 6,7-dimethyl-8-ribityllumazine synthase [Chthoniobacterales bacterium]